jgi:hypothetical protein
MCVLFLRCLVFLCRPTQPALGLAVVTVIGDDEDSDFDIDRSIHSLGWFYSQHLHCGGVLELHEVHEDFAHKM